MLEMKNPNTKHYEFGRASLVDRAPLLLAKSACFLFVLFGCWMCLRTEEPNVLDGLASVLVFSIAYTILDSEKYELRKVFIEPFNMLGFPLVLLAIGLSMYSLYLGFS
jgi:hypothetical protein